MSALAIPRKHVLARIFTDNDVVKKRERRHPGNARNNNSTPRFSPFALCDASFLRSFVIVTGVSNPHPDAAATKKETKQLVFYIWIWIHPYTCQSHFVCLQTEAFNFPGQDFGSDTVSVVPATKRAIATHCTGVRTQRRSTLQSQLWKVVGRWFAVHFVSGREFNSSPILGNSMAAELCCDVSNK